jgi:hypothetical protein
LTEDLKLSDKFLDSLHFLCECFVFITGYKEKSGNTIDIIKIKSIEKIFDKTLYEVSSNVITWFREANLYSCDEYLLNFTESEFIDLDNLIKDLAMAFDRVNENWDPNHDNLPCINSYPFKTPINVITKQLSETLKSNVRRFT